VDVLSLAARLSPAALAVVAVIAIVARAACALHRQHLEHRGLRDAIRDVPAEKRATVVRAYAEVLSATRRRRPHRQD
jgi:hypothetical protein